MDAAKAERVKHHVCSGKNSYSWPTAVKVAAEMTLRSGRIIRAYRCPFDRRHSHIGHVPSMSSVAEVAAAVRFFATGYEGD